MKLSVVGSRVSPASNDARFVKDGLTGKDFEFSAPRGYPDTASLWLVQWLNDDTVVLHADQGDQADLLTCQVSTGECTLALQVAPDAVVPEISSSVAPYLSGPSG